MYNLLNNINIAYFWHNVFNKTELLFWRVAVNIFKVLCIYDMTLVLLKLNGKICSGEVVHVFMSSLKS